MALDQLFSLKDKVIVITGAAGTGCMHAEAVAAYGGTPILLDLSFEQVDKIAKSSFISLIVGPLVLPSI